MNIRHMSLLFAAILISLVAKTAIGAGGESNYSSELQKPSGYDEAVVLIEAGKYLEAISPLHSAERVSQNDADIKNLLGFVHRKIGELDAAGGYYQRALEINPKHKGALEYQGELFLIRGDRVAAKANLAKLDKICWLGCSEYTDLKKAIAELQ